MNKQLTTNPKPVRITVRGIDLISWKQAKLDAFKQEISQGQWLNSAMFLKLNFEEEACEFCRVMGWTEPT